MYMCQKCEKHSEDQLACTCCKCHKRDCLGGQSMILLVYCLFLGHRVRINEQTNSLLKHGLMMICDYGDDIMT